MVTCVKIVVVVVQKNVASDFHRQKVSRLQRNNEKHRVKYECGSHANNRPINKNIQENAMADIFVIESIHGF